MDTQITSLNHYVPRAYLARWSSDGSNVWEHKLIVPIASYPLWRRASLREACARRNLYDIDLPEHRVDHYERWLHHEVEEPAYAVIRKIEAGCALTKGDWYHLVQFAAAQDFRTLKDLERHVVLEQSIVPRAMNHAIKRGLADLHRGSFLPSTGRRRPADESPLVTTRIVPGSDSVTLEVSLDCGSTSWLQRLKPLVRWITQQACRHPWALVAPHGNRTWPTSDHPLVRFERMKDIAIHNTGWRRRNTEIFFPLTPKVAMHARVGAPAPTGATASAVDTNLFIQLLVGFAHRSVFADRRDYKPVEWASKRIVDREEFEKVRNEQ